LCASLAALGSGLPLSRLLVPTSFTQMMLLHLLQISLMLTVATTTFTAPITALLLLLLPQVTVIIIRALVTVIIITAQLATSSDPQLLLITLHLISAQLCCHQGASTTSTFPGAFQGGACSST
jgi:hypothetical protein